jgi:serine phosphatase RsbU (regulator of sigma subunit)
VLEIQIAAAKVNKYASRESGDTVEVVERPGGMGGFTAVLVDGQGSGRSAKNLSNMVASKCVALIKEGARDGVVARAASDQLFAYRNGQVSATLNLLSVDFVNQSLIITRNNPAPVYLARYQPGAEFNLTDLKETSHPIGIYARSRPVIAELEIEPGMWAIAFSDGLLEAGARYEEKFDLPAAIAQQIQVEGVTAQICADKLLEFAIRHDRQRPADDMSVVVLTIQTRSGEDGDPLPRRLNLSVPFI